MTASQCGHCHLFLAYCAYALKWKCLCTAGHASHLIIFQAAAWYTLTWYTNEELEENLSFESKWLHLHQQCQEEFAAICRICRIWTRDYKKAYYLAYSAYSSAYFWISYNIFCIFYHFALKLAIWKNAEHENCTIILHTSLLIFCMFCIFKVA